MFKLISKFSKWFLLQNLHFGFIDAQNRHAWKYSGSVSNLASMHNLVTGSLLHLTCICLVSQPLTCYPSLSCFWYFIPHWLDPPSLLKPYHSTPHIPLWTQNVYKKKLFLSSKSIRPGFRCSQLAFTEHVCSCKTLGKVTFISTLFFIDNVQVLKRFKFKIEAMYNRTWKQSQSPRRARGHPGGSGIT